jgi:phosphate starvation-inducible PhoH-like protein
MVEYSITVNPELVPNLVGPHDRNLRRLIHAVRSRLVVRGGEIHVDGPPEEKEPLQRLFRDLAGMAAKGVIEEALVDAALNLAGFMARVPNGNSGNGEGLIVYERSGFTLRTRSRNQEEYVRATREAELVFCVGPAGTGKTYLAVAVAVRALVNDEMDRIILVRPAVEAGESLGFLPGDLKEKVEPYFRPLYDALMDMLTPEKLRRLMEQGRIEIAPLAYMRGRTLNNAFVILDEAQNTTAAQLKMFLTRLGARSKSIVTGDLTQIDLQDPIASGLSDAMVILQGIRGIRFVTLDATDVVRHQLVKEIVEAYERERGSQARE